MLAWSERRGDPRTVINDTEALIARFTLTNRPILQYDPKTQPPPPDFNDPNLEDVTEQFRNPPKWGDVAAHCRRLTYINQKIARSRAMLALATNPEPYSTYDWQERTEWAKHPWQYYEQSNRILYTIMVALVSLLLAVPASWLGGLLLSWLWYFSLARIAELSKAVKGTE